jgi:hypothetical protein
MTALTRNLASVVLLLTCLGGVVSAWQSPGGVDWAECWRDYVETRRREEQLDQQLRAIHARITAKGEAAWGLIEGRLTLLEAAARFREANEATGDRFGAYWRWADRPEGERLCRQVIEWVDAELRTAGAPVGDRVLVGRLEAELAEHLGRYGTVELPRDDKVTR